MKKCDHYAYRRGCDAGATWSSGTGVMMVKVWNSVNG